MKETLVRYAVMNGKERLGTIQLPVPGERDLWCQLSLAEGKSHVSVAMTILEAEAIVRGLTEAIEGWRVDAVGGWKQAGP